MTDTRPSSGAAGALSQQLIDASKRAGVDTYTATLLLHASQMVDRLTPALPTGLVRLFDRLSPQAQAGETNTDAEPSRCKNQVARGESMETDALTGDAPRASVSTLHTRLQAALKAAAAYIELLNATDGPDLLAEIRDARDRYEKAKEIAEACGVVQS